MTKSDKIYEMFVPSVGESINEVTISSWLKSNGDYVELDEIIAEIDSDKATFELTAEASGNLIIEAEEGTTLEIGKLICKIEIKEISKEKKESQDQKEVLTENKSEVITKERSESTPVAKKIMDEKGIDPKEISGTGAGGKITKEDVINSEQKVEASSTVDSSEVQTVGNRNQRREKMTQLRKTISKRLVESKFTSPHFYLTMEINMDNCMEGRERINESSDIIISMTEPKQLSSLNFIKTKVSEIIYEDKLICLILIFGNNVLKAHITIKSFKKLKLKKGLTCFAIIKAININNFFDISLI